MRKSDRIESRHDLVALPGNSIESPEDSTFWFIPCLTTRIEFATLVSICLQTLAPMRPLPRTLALQESGEIPLASPKQGLGLEVDFEAE